MESDDEGRFHGILPREGPWKIEVQAAEPAFSTSARAEVDAGRSGKATLDIRLPDTRIFGRVVDEQGKPVARADVIPAGFPHGISARRGWLRFRLSHSWRDPVPDACSCRLERFRGLRPAGWSGRTSTCFPATLGKPPAAPRSTPAVLRSSPATRRRPSATQQSLPAVLRRFPATLRKVPSTLPDLWPTLRSPRATLPKSSATLPKPPATQMKLGETLRKLQATLLRLPATPPKPLATQAKLRATLRKL